MHWLLESSLWSYGRYSYNHRLVCKYCYPWQRIKVELTEVDLREGETKVKDKMAHLPSFTKCGIKQLKAERTRNRNLSFLF